MNRIKLTIVILLSSCILTGQEDTTVVVFDESPVFSVDTYDPSVIWYAPNGGEIFSSGEVISGSWSASDDSFIDFPIAIFVATTIGGDFDLVAEDLPNDGSGDFQLPSVNSAFARSKIRAVDEFGNEGVDFSDGYFTIGEPAGGGGDTTLILSNESPVITVDSENPSVDWLSPDGGEVFSSGEVITGTWSATDVSFGSNPINISLATSIGGVFDLVAEGIPNDGSADLTLPITDTLYGRFKIAAMDVFRNTTVDYSLGYFTIGEPGTGGISDTTVVLMEESDSIWVDTQNPTVDLLYPDGREAFLEGSEFPVQWIATDSSFDENPIIISLATEIGGIFEPQTSEIPNSSEYSIFAPDTTTNFARARVTATDHFGNTRSDESQDYFTIFPSGTGAITGKIVAARAADGFLYLDLWFPGSDPNVDQPDIEQDSIYVNFVEGDSFTYSFSGLLPDSGYSILAFLDQTGSPTSGTDICDYGYDIWCEIYDIRVLTNEVTENVDITLEECVIPPYSGPVWHVSTSGDDSLGNGSEVYPFELIQHGIDMSSDGDTILIAEGEYVENIIIDRKSLVISAIPGDIVIINGNNQSNVVRIDTCASIVLEGLHIKNGLGDTVPYNVGGGVLAIYSGVSIYSCIIESSSADYGGGIAAKYSWMIMTDSIVRNNSSEWQGGGVFAVWGNYQLNKCKIDNNTVTGDYGGASGGGGVYAYYSDITIDSCLISNNTENQNYGGGFYITGASDQTSFSITNSIFFGNTSKGRGGAIYSGPDIDGTGTIVNTICWNDTVLLDGHDREIDSWGSLNVSYSIVDGGYLYPGDGVLTSDPLFCDPYNSDFTVASNSPALGSGENGSNIGGVEIGCQPPYSGPTWYISTTGSDETGDGSEVNPFATIQYGIDMAVDGDTVLVQPGTYVENINFHGKGIAVFGEDIETTIIDGYQDGSVVIFDSGEDSTSILSGFTIQNGYWEGPSWGGGGINCIGVSPRLVNLIISGNTANTGGGIYLGYSSPNLVNVAISGNTADNGGGIFCEGSNPTLVNVTISGNSSNNNGGGITSLASSNPILVNSILWSNLPEEIYFSGEWDPNAVTISYSDVQGGLDSIVTNDNGTVNWGDGNIDLYPQFVDSANGDYHLADNSPCISAGADSVEIDGVWYYAPLTDIEGNPRPNPPGSNPDMGAYESPLGEPQGAILSVVPDFLDFGFELDTLQVYIQNTGMGDLSWQIIEEIPWLAVFPDSNGQRTNKLGILRGQPRLMQDGPTLQSDVAGFRTSSRSGDLEGSLVDGQDGILSYDSWSKELKYLKDIEKGRTVIDTVFVTVDRTGLEPGTYNGIIYVLSNGGNDTIAVTISQPDLIPPASPMNLSATSGDQNVVLRWSLNPEPDVLLYRIYRDTTSSPTVFIDSIFHPDTFYVDLGLVNGQMYYYQITAVDTIGNESDFSAEVSITPLPSYSGSVWYISTDGSDMNGNGSESFPFATIQHGIDVVSEHDTVLVQPGTYSENINFNGKNLILGSWFLSTDDTSFISQTVIDGNQNGSVVTFDSGENSTTILEGFTIQNGNAVDGGGIYCIGASPTITNCVITGNTANQGGGISFFNGSNPNLENVTISGNTANAFGGGILCAYSSSPDLENVTITGNSSSLLEGGGIHLWNNSSLALVNTILWNDSHPEIYFDTDGGPNTITISYSDIQDGIDNIVTNNNGTVNWGDGNSDADPLFTAPATSDFTLQWGSPCIDAGDPNSDPDPDGTIVDMGAFYYDQTYQPPNVPANLSYIPSADHITLKWSPVIVYDISRYHLYHSEDGVSFLQIATVDAPDTAYVDAEINTWIPNYYYLVAEDTMGLVSENSDVLEVSYPLTDLSTNILEFDTVITGYPQIQQVVLYNIGSDTLNVSSIYIAGGDANYFSVDIGTGKSKVAGSRWQEQVTRGSRQLAIGNRQSKIENKENPSSLQQESLVGRVEPDGSGGTARSRSLIGNVEKSTSVRSPLTGLRRSPLANGSLAMTGERKVTDTPTNKDPEAKFQISNLTNHVSRFTNYASRISTNIIPGDSLGLLVTFAPLDTGDFADELIIISDDPTGSDILSVALSGSAVAPFLSFSLEYIDFGSVFVDSTAFRSAMVRNVGRAPLEVTAITSSDQDHFSISPNSIPSIQPGDSAQIIVTFTPSELDTFTSVMTLTSNDLFNPIQTISLQGVGSPYNYLPMVASVAVLPLEEEEHFDTVLIYYALSDVDDDTLSLVFEYLSEDSLTWFTAEIMEVGELSAIGSQDYSGAAHWLSHVDFPAQEVPEVTLRLTVSDSYGSSEEVVLIHVDNYHGDLTIDPVQGEQLGDVDIHYTLMDPWGDVFSITPQYFDSLSGEWTDATVTGELVGIGLENYSGNITWLTREDLPSNEDLILFRMIPHDGLQFGTGDTIPIAVDNVAPPRLLAYEPTISNVTSWMGVEIPVSFSSEIDESTIEFGFTIEGEVSGSHSFDYSYNTETKTVVLFPETIFAGAETVTVTISTLLTDTFSIPFDGNGNGDLDPDEDSFSWQFVTTLLGDYTTNGIVNYIDLADFREAWVDTQLHIVRDIGPADGEVPKLLPTQDSLFNFEDLMVFAQMWNWSYENEDYTDSTQMLAKIEGTDNPVGLTLNFSDKNVWLPETDQKISIAVRFDSLSSFTVFGMEYQYNPEVLHFVRYESIIDKPWSLLSFSNHEKGKIVIAGALLGESSPEITPGNAIILNFSKLRNSDTEIDYSVSLWDTDGKNKTYPVGKFLFSSATPLPEKFVFHPNFPNPFNPATTIRYEIPTTEHVNVSIYNILGQKVLSLVNETKEAGYHQIEWRGQDQSGIPVSSGIYIIYFHSRGFSSHRKIILLK